MTDKYPDLLNLRHPEDLATENIYELVGLYMRVYTQYCRASFAITSRITGEPEIDQHLSGLVLAYEQPLETWMNLADDYLPEWFNPKLLAYPEPDYPEPVKAAIV